MKSKEKKTKWRWLAPFFAVLMIVAGALLWVKMEGTPPRIEVAPEPLSLGIHAEVMVTVSDAKSGLSRVKVEILKENKAIPLLEEDFKSPGIFAKSGIREKTYAVVVEPKKLSLADGKATLRVMARDHSWRHWFHGNPGYLEKETVIDTRPPQIVVLSKFHYLNQGGTGLVVYRLTEPCTKTGVRVGEHFFPGYGGHPDDPQRYVAFFALKHTQGPETPIAVEAVDGAGNTARTGFSYHIKARRFKKDVIGLSDGFLGRILPRFESQIDGADTESLIDRFLVVNRALRQKNYQEMVQLTAESEKTQLWDGPFLRLPNSERQAGFADHRDYVYQGKKVDEQVHLGIDLAATAHAQVPAANGGKVAFAGELGIYGQTILIDHGLGVFSMYSHLSDYAVQKGQEVAKGDIIGHTGDTGLAGGDHLHFSMVIHDTFVHPVEWWDPLWIEKRINAKLAGTESG